MSARIESPWSIVLLNWASSLAITLKIKSFFSSSSGYPSFDPSMTVCASSTRNAPLIPRSLPWRHARRRRRLNTYPRPLFDGRIPSEIINVTERMWSVNTRIEVSVLSSFWYSTPAMLHTWSLKAFNVSMSNIESTSCTIHARRSSPIPVSMFFCSNSV